MQAPRTSQRRFACRSVLAFGIVAIGAAWPSQAHAEGDMLLCPMMHAKQLPKDFRVAAMTFTGPSGDGRRGSTGFVVQTRQLIAGSGTRLSFTFHRHASGYGFQVIHPLAAGHVLVSVHSGVAMHRGGSWGDIGWGNPATSDKPQMTEAAAEVLPLKAGVAHRVVSQLSAKGEYQLSIDGKLICRNTIKDAEPLTLDVSMGKSFWAGSSWDRTPFAGKDFNSNLQPGHAGLILGPMDGSAPQQNFQQIHLAAVDPAPADGAPATAQNQALQALLQEVRLLRREIKSLEARIEKIERATNP